jgi:hypothetical protein
MDSIMQALEAILEEAKHITQKLDKAIDLLIKIKDKK